MHSSVICQIIQDLKDQIERQAPLTEQERTEVNRLRTYLFSRFGKMAFKERAIHDRITAAEKQANDTAAALVKLTQYFESKAKEIDGRLAAVNEWSNQIAKQINRYEHRFEDKTNELEMKGQLDKLYGASQQTMNRLDKLEQKMEYCEVSPSLRRQIDGAITKSMSNDKRLDTLVAWLRKTFNRSDFS